MSRRPDPALDARALGDLLQRALEDESAPPRVLARAVALDARSANLARGAGALARRLVAVLVDAASGGFAPAYGVRGAAPAQQRLYRAEECEIDLRVRAQGSGWSVAGQVFGAGDAQRLVLVGPAFAAEAALGPTAEFRFDDLRPGRYVLTLEAGEVHVVIPDLDVGATDPG